MLLGLIVLSRGWPLYPYECSSGKCPVLLACFEIAEFGYEQVVCLCRVLCRVLSNLVICLVVFEKWKLSKQNFVLLLEKIGLTINGFDYLT